MATGWHRVHGSLRTTLLKYGKLGLAVHFSISTVSLVSCYTAVCFKLPVETVLQRLGLANDESGSPDGPAAVASTAATTGGAALAALVLHKALFPLRAPVTVAITPAVAAALARLGRRGSHW
mmetsp:Transcript_35200/g.111932  ORF Transcript_35200/g.111932 Transcript_35200/m.111932 type:complete len:122 (-) Transcript_35200:157-522(-)